MIDLKLLDYLETYLTDKRKVRFEEVLSKRTKHFTVAIEDVYQLHNTSAVIRIPLKSALKKLSSKDIKLSQQRLMKMIVYWQILMKLRNHVSSLEEKQKGFLMKSLNKLMVF